MATRVLVTGAAGFIGSHVANACVAAGFDVTGVDNRVPVDGSPQETSFLHCDMSGPEVLRAIEDSRFSAVLHLAAISSTLETNWPRLQKANVTAPLNLARACRSAGTRFIYASSHSVYGNIIREIPVAERAVDDRRICSGPLNRYAESKLLLDQSMADDFPSELAWVGLRFTNVFGTGEEHKGPMASIISQLLRQAAYGRTLQLFADSLTASRDYVPVSYVADICVRLVSAPVPSGVYNLGAGHAVSFGTLLEWCAAFSDGRQVNIRLVPNPVRDRYQFWTCADVAKIGQALSQQPRLTQDDIRMAAMALYATFRSSCERGT
jgi:ADP-L-glycero-D-manno-heptose 6-epimerase